APPWPSKPDYGFGVVVSSWVLLIHGNHAAREQQCHLSPLFKFPEPPLWADLAGKLKLPLDCVKVYSPKDVERFLEDLEQFQESILTVK
ncbi:MAG: hypothetical protein OXB94_04425, partial [Nitrospira sp.]|nr:hypothetical protein [Nitrospira sp.]